jgi:hypothetical protein
MPGSTYDANELRCLGPPCIRTAAASRPSIKEEVLQHPAAIAEFANLPCGGPAASPRSLS